MILDNKLDNLLRNSALIQLHTSGTFMFQKWGMSKLQTYQNFLVSRSGVRKEKKIKLKQLSFWFLETTTSFHFQIFQNTYSVSKYFLCTYRWWKQEGGLLELDRPSYCDMLRTGQPLALSVSVWSPCVQQCGPSCSGFPTVADLSWWHRLTHCSTERSQPSICLFFPSIHSCFSVSLTYPLIVSHLPRFI